MADEFLTDKENRDINFWWMGGRKGAKLPDFVPLPPSIGTLQLWLDASDAGTIIDAQDATYVEQWTDKSPAGRNFVQPLVAYKPRTGQATIGGVNTITFNPATDADHLENDSPFIANAVNTTIYLVGNITATADDYILHETRGTSSFPYYEILKTRSTTPVQGNVTTYRDDTNTLLGTAHSSSPEITPYDGTDSIFIWQELTTQNKLTFVSNDGTVKVVTYDRSAGVPSTLIDKIVLGAQTISSPSNGINGNIGELRVYDGDHDAAIMNQIGAELGTKWSIPWTNI